MVVGTYLNECNPLSPNNLVIIDNIDQVPTELIETLAGYLGQLADRRHELRLVVPLRPSSIMRAGFVKSSRYLFHYGPDCFEMLERRVSRYVLSRARAEMAETNTPDHPTPFMKKPTSEELDVFVLTTYLYALVVAAGKALANDRDVADQAAWPADVHSDHRFARGLKFSPVVMRHFAETLGAVVGTCARYADEQLRRYYEHIYSSSGLLSEIAAALKYGAHTSLRLPYGSTVTSLLGRSEGDSGYNGLANLYRPTEYTGTGDRPTLAKIRILRRLRSDGSSVVRDVLVGLVQYGIPAEISLEALNYLHTKERLLLWFSRNSDLTLSEDHLNQEVVISEHGEQYLDYVVSDFEYIWFCASKIPGDRLGKSPSGFRARLDEYSRLMSHVATTEWKQLSFQRAASNAVWDEGSAGRSAEFLTLSLLYRSLTRAVISASRGVLRRADLKSAAKIYKTDIEDMIATVCDAVLLHQARFLCAFGDASYLTAEATQIARVRPHLTELLRVPRLSGRCQTSIDNLLSSWDADPSVARRFLNEVPASDPPADLMTNVTKYSPGNMPGIIAIVNTLNRLDGGRVLLWNVLRRRSALADLLRDRLPTFSIVRRYMKNLETDLRVAEESSRAAAAGAEGVAWLDNELNWVRNSVAILDENRFDTVALCRKREMSEKKQRSNNILECFAAVAQRFGIQNSRHLEETWQ